MNNRTVTVRGCEENTSSEGVKDENDNAKVMNMWTTLENSISGIATGTLLCWRVGTCTHEAWPQQSGGSLRCREAAGHG